MIQYFKYENINEDVGINKYKKAIEKINKVYRDKLQLNGDEKIEYDLSQKFDKLELAKYNEETFLLPDVILNLLYEYENEDDNDLSDYKHIIELIFLNKGEFKMSDEHKKYYLENFDNLLTVNSLHMKSQFTNIHTLYQVARLIYAQDKKALDKKLSKNPNCSLVNKQIETYNKIKEFFIKKSINS